jgi:hypothetical protein
LALAFPLAIVGITNQDSAAYEKPQDQSDYQYGFDPIPLQ